MKKLLSLNSEFILDIRLMPKVIRDENGSTAVEWIDDTKKLAKCKQSVYNVYSYAQEFGADGYPTSKFIKINLNKNDILTLAESIKEIEAAETAGIPDDDLPF